MKFSIEQKMKFSIALILSLEQLLLSVENCLFVVDQKTFFSLIGKGFCIKPFSDQL